MYINEEKKLISLMSGLCVMCGGWVLHHPLKLSLFNNKCWEKLLIHLVHKWIMPLKYIVVAMS